MGGVIMITYGCGTPRPQGITFLDGTQGLMSLMTRWRLQMAVVTFPRKDVEKEVKLTKKQREKQAEEERRQEKREAENRAREEKRQKQLREKQAEEARKQAIISIKNQAKEKVRQEVGEKKQREKLKKQAKKREKFRKKMRDLSNRIALIDPEDFLYKIDDNLVAEGWEPLTSITVDGNYFSNRYKLISDIGWDDNLREEMSVYVLSGKPCVVFYERIDSWWKA